MKIYKKMKFDTAHVLHSSHTKKCQSLHGHTFHVTFGLYDKSNKLNNDGMVIDFTLVKKLLNAIVDFLDHSMIIPKASGYGEVLADMSIANRLIITPFNPTAENLAVLIYIYTYKLLKIYNAQNKTNLVIDSVALYETEDNYVVYDGSSSIHKNFNINIGTLPNMYEQHSYLFSMLTISESMEDEQ